MVVSVFGRSFTSLARDFNIVHTFVCGDDTVPSTANANESISDWQITQTSALIISHILLDLIQ